MAYENGGWNQIKSKALTWDIAVEVRPHGSICPILIVVASNVNSLYLWIVNPQASLNGICLDLPLSIGLIGIVLGNNSSHGIPT